MKDIKEQLFFAISDQNVELVRHLLASGADPNDVGTYRDSALCVACDSFHTPENRFLMVEALLDAGADPKQVDDSGGGVLFSSVIAKDTKLIEYLLSRGADPNLEHDLGETLYDWAEFDYRYDEYDLNLPEEPTEEDKVNADTWLAYLSRLAEIYHKRPPDYLIALRNAGALTGREKDLLVKHKQF